MRSCITVFASLLALLPLASATAQSVLWVTNSAAFGPGSLRDAVLNLQPAAGGVQEIRFALSAQTGTTIYLNQPMPDIVGAQVRIDASDTSAGVTIDAAGHAIFRVAAGSTTNSLTVANLTLRRGGIIGSGGCIGVARAATSLLLDHVTLQECRAYLDAATAPAYGGAVFAAGPLTVRDSVFVGNELRTLGSAVVGANAAGGAIGKTGNHPVTIERSEFRDNRVYLTNTDAPFCRSGAGGALALALPGSPGVSVQISDNQFVNNSTPCRNPSVSTDLDGAGDGGALSLAGERAQFHLSANFFQANRGYRGGAISVIQAGFSEVSLVNNTLHANHGNSGGGGIVVNNCCYLQFLNNTFSDNSSTVDNFGSQLSVIGAGTLTVFHNNLINGPGAGALCTLNAGQLSAGFNLFTRNDCAVAGDSSSQLVGAMTWLQAPTISGGYVPTMRSDYGSPSIDSGDDSRCPLYDARGLVRPLDGNGDAQARCDIGAVENSLVDRLFRNGFE